jgi:hypothetical protein
MMNDEWWMMNGGCWMPDEKIIYDIRYTIYDLRLCERCPPLAGQGVDFDPLTGKQ